MGDTKRILLVEDFDDSRFSLSRLLEIEGYDVIEASDGAQAVSLAIEFKPDLILMDLTLPVIDGLSATRQIREMLGAIPIIALTGHDRAEFEVQARAAGCTDWIAKPIDFDALASVISKYLSG
jgi:two-component system cell cycle response regulator DivK